MSHLTEEELSDLRANLEAERDSLDEELPAQGTSVSGDWQASTRDFAKTEADPSDAADNIEELATRVPLVEELETRRKEVDAALKKMKKGTYGLCDVCSGEIPLDRLEANPAAATCITHTA